MLLIRFYSYDFLSNFRFHDRTSLQNEKAKSCCYQKSFFSIVLYPISLPTVLATVYIIIVDYIYVYLTDENIYKFNAPVKENCGRCDQVIWRDTSRKRALLLPVVTVFVYRHAGQFAVSILIIIPVEGKHVSFL